MRFGGKGSEMSLFDPKQDEAALNGVIDHFFDRLEQFMNEQIDTLEISIGGMPITIRKTPKP
jgi:hypothetical protein